MNLQIGSHIRKIRMLKGYPEKYMSEQLKISIAMYSKLEKKEGNISMEYVLRIAEILQVPYTCIVEFDEEKFFRSYI